MLPVLDGDLKRLYEATTKFIELDQDAPPDTDMSLDTVVCADTRKDMSRDKVIAAIIKEIESTWGTNAVTSTAPSAEALCHHWPVVGEERFSGP